MYTPLKEALEKPNEVTALEITKEDIKAGVPADVEKLSQVRKLSVSGEENGNLAFPAALLALPISDLEIRHFRIFEVTGFKALKKLNFSSHFIHEDMLPICKHFARLTSLTIWGDDPKRALVLPPEIGNLKDLEELKLVTCAMDSLPEELSQLVKLKRVLLRNHNFKEFPLALTKIPNLETLEFSYAPLLTSLPDEMRNMTNLKSLSLNRSFKAKIKSWKDGFQVPEVIGELHRLEELDLDRCEVDDIQSIVRLPNLKKLTLQWAKFKGLEVLSTMINLEELDLTSVRTFKKLAPLTQLPRLKKLTLSSCEMSDLSPLLQMTALEELSIDGCLYLKDISPVINHPTLKKLRASPTVMKQWEQRVMAASVPPKDKILESLNSSDLKQIEEGIQQLTTYVRLNSGEVSALFKFFDLDASNYRKREIVEIEVLSKLVSTHGARLSSQSVVSLVSIGLNRNIKDNFKITLDAIKILIDRKDAAGQKQVVEIFKNACEYYDAGHRFWEDTVQDQLLDSLFPEFEGDALAELLIWCESDHLMNDLGLDGMDRLFKPAFERVQDKELEESLLEKFIEYVEEDPDYVRSSGILDDHDHASPKVKKAIKNLKAEVGESEDEDDQDDEDQEEDDSGNHYYLTYKEGTSDKFWQITISGNSFTVKYGKTGSSGTEKTKEFDDEDECRKEADKLIQEKLKKGYKNNSNT